MNPILTVAVMTIANAFIGRMGTSALAGYGIGARLEFLMVPVIFGIGAALITMVGANVGAGAITGAIGLAAALTPGWWADSFTIDPAVAEACRRYLQTVGPFYALFGLGLALYALTGARRRIAAQGYRGRVRLADRDRGDDLRRAAIGRRGRHGFVRPVQRNDLAPVRLAYHAEPGSWRVINRCRDLTGHASPSNSRTACPKRCRGLPKVSRIEK